MKESHSEDQASHAGPESCEGVREGTLEALTGEPAGRAIEPRNQVINREADTLMASGRPYRACRHGKARPAPARSENQGMWGSFSRGSREIPSLAQPRMRLGPRRESLGSTTPMHGPGKSDRSIVPKKAANKVGVRKPAAELMEERERAEGNPCGQISDRTQCRIRLQQALAGIRGGGKYRLAVKTRGRSPVRQSRPLGSVRGPPGNRRSYRDRPRPNASRLVRSLDPGGIIEI